MQTFWPVVTFLLYHNHLLLEQTKPGKKKKLKVQWDGSCYKETATLSFKV